MIKVLNIVGSANGGVASYLETMNYHLDKSKIQSDFLINKSSSNKENSFIKKINKNGSQVYKLPNFEDVSFIKYLKLLTLFYKENNDYDIIHIHSPNLSLINVVISRRFLNAKIIVHSHSVSYSDSILKSIRNFMLIAPMRLIKSGKIACSSNAGIFLFGKKSYNNGEVFIAKNAIDTNQFIFDNKKRKEVRKSLGIKNEFVIGHVGTFNPIKNHSFLLEVFKRVLTYKKNSTLILVGSGPLEKEIKEKATQLGIYKKTKFLGQVEDVSSLYQAFDIMVFPSISEGLGIVAIEAQAAGLPSLVSDNVPLEVKITDLVEFKNLNDHPDDWAEKALLAESISRINTMNQIKKSGYDVTDASKQLEKYYTKLYNQNI